MTGPWLSVDDIAADLGVTRDSVCTGIPDKGMPARKIGRVWMLQTNRVENCIRSATADSTYKKAGE